VNTFAHSLSQPLAGRDPSESERQPNFNTVIALLVAAVVALLISGALVFNSMNSQIENLQTNQIAVQQEDVQSHAFSACIENHGSAAGVTARCRAAAATFAANDADAGAFDRAVTYLYPR
jgi:mannitol-specific phosphotransferase system IIBC component